jgi:TP901 family phage tail tape measure protein
MDNTVLGLGLILTAKDMFSPKLGAASENLTKFEAKVKATGKTMTKLGTGMAAFGTILGAPLKSFYNDYEALAQNQGELESLGVGAEGIKAITKEAKSFSNQFAKTSAPEFIKAAYDIKSGISSLSDEGVAKMTAFSSMTAQATRSSSGDMAKLFALGHGIFASDFGSDFDFAEKFGAAISTATKMFRTDGADLIGGIANVKAAAKSMGVSLEEELAIIGVAKSSFDSASEAATGYRSFLDNVGQAQEKLGLQFTDSQGKMLPMTEILKTIKNDIGDLSIVENSDKLKDAFGSDEAVQLVKSLIDKTGDLSEAQSSLRGNMDKGTESIEKMARSMNKGNRLKLLGNQMSNLGSSIGTLFAPAIDWTADVLGGMIEKLDNWIERNPNLAAGLGTTLAVVAGLATVVGTLGIGVGAIMMIAPGVATAIGGISAALGIAKIAVMALGNSLLMNPIFALIGGLAYLVWEFWEPITEKFNQFFNWLGEKIEWFKGIGSGIADWLGFGDDKSSISASKTVQMQPLKTTPLVTPNIKANSGKQEINVKKIEIINPKSTVDVEQGIKNGFKNNGTPLYDQEI